MPLVEIEEGTLAEYKQVSDSVKRMLANPAARRKILEAQKDINPDLVIPELDAAKPIYDKVDGLTKKMDEFMAAQAEASSKREERERMSEMRVRWEAGQREARAQGYMDDGLKALEDFMEKRGIAEHEIAIPAFERLHPPTTTGSPGVPERFDIFQPSARSDENLKLLFDGADEQFLAKVLPAAMLEANPGRGARR